MTLRVRYVPEALIELADLALRFDEYQALLGDKVISLWNESLQRILLHPGSCPEFYRATRKLLIRPYHIHVVYRELKDVLVVLLAYDARRDPDVIRGVLDARLEDE